MAILWLLACSPPAAEPPSAAPTLAARAEPSATIPPPPRPTAAPRALSPASSPVASPRPLVRGSPVASTRPRTAGLGSLSDAVVAIGVARGFFREQGLEPQVIELVAPSQVLQALSAGQLEVACLPVSAELLNALARGAPFKIVAEATGSPTGHGASGLIVRADLVGVVRTPTDLRGLKVGLQARGSGPDAELAHLLRQGWLAREDVETVILASDEVEPGLADGGLDAAMVAEPLLSDLERRGLGRVWRRSDEIVPDRLTAVLVVSSRLIRTQPERVRAFLTAYLKAARLYNDAFIRGQTDRQELLGILARTTGSPPDVLDRAVLPGVNPNGMLNVQSLRLDERYFLAGGLQQRPLELPLVIDTQFTTYAITQLGEYR